ncbi:MAG: DNA primase catalytic subunit PriS [Candidatus Heimdallarchaeota archaeon]|nr:DNA primase catalytic subunit PriS [Candidatus Heimdallarchaeota archaeon]
MLSKGIKTAIRDYYTTNFNLKELEQVISFEHFENREFGFVPPSGRFFRNLSFESPNALKDYLADRTPLHAYIGALYDAPPSREHPIHTLEWKGHELVFDIDLNEYDSVRSHICDCQGANQVCIRCWQLVVLAISIIDETLREDFGLSKITWLFSGRRGVHGWVQDSVGFELGQGQRMSIINYLTVLLGENETARVQDRDSLKYEFRKRVEHGVFDFFLKNARKKDLMSLGFSSSLASNFQKQIEQQDGKIDQNLSMRFNKSLAKINKYDEILRRWVPRIDHKVSIDLRRLLRLPGSIHGKTGKSAQILKPNEIFSFNPENVSSIFPSVPENE